MVIKFDKQFEVNFDIMEVHDYKNEQIYTLNYVDTDKWSFEDFSGKQFFLTKHAYQGPLTGEWFNSYLITEVIERNVTSVTCKQNN